MSDHSGTVHERLTTEECWALLASETFGRLAYRLVDEVHVVPLDYAVAGTRIYLRTASGNKLLAAELESDVALETDWRGPSAAWSVVVRGRLRRLGPGEVAEVVPEPRPWLGDQPHEVVELVASAIDGRRFRWEPDAGAPAYR